MRCTATVAVGVRTRQQACASQAMKLVPISQANFWASVGVGTSPHDLLHACRDAACWPALDSWMSFLALVIIGSAAGCDIAKHQIWRQRASSDARSCTGGICMQPRPQHRGQEGEAWHRAARICAHAPSRCLADRLTRRHWKLLHLGSSRT